MQSISWKSLLPYSIIVIVSVVALLDLFHSGLPLTHDGQDHVARIANFYADLTQGILIPRWAPYLNWGYGHPVMMFLYPLPSYFASFFLALGCSLYTAVKLVFGVSFILSGITMYLFLQRIFNKNAALGGAVLYMFAPYRFVDMYVRGAIGEHVAFIFLPLILFFIHKTAREYRPSSLILASLSITGLLLSHNAISIMFLPIILVYMVYESNFDKKILLRFGFILSIGFLLASFFLLPALLEGKYTLRDIVTSNEYASRFVQLPDLFYSKWSYGGSGNFSVQVGIIQWLSVLAAIFIVLLPSKKSKKYRSVIIAVVAIFIISLLLMLPISKPVYETFTVLQKFQFPWRFLTISVFTSTILTAYMLFYIPKKYQRVATGIIIILTLLFTSTYWHANGYLEKPETFFTKDYPGTTDTGESAPIWSVRFMEKFPKQHIEVIDGNIKIQEHERKAYSHSYTLYASNDSRMRENTVYFPGWEVLVNSKKTPIEFQDQANRGLITFYVQKGKNDVIIQFKETKLRVLGNLLSLMGILLLILYGILEGKKKWKVFQ